jgi:hypothetical protein
LASTAFASATMFRMAYENRLTRDATGTAREAFVDIALFYGLPLRLSRRWNFPFSPVTALLVTADL